jgi:predicted nucleotidyltransferase component of viral defense system
MTAEKSQWIHEDSELLQSALNYTAAETGFSARLIEKDYFCSLILEQLGPLFDTVLVFKGGTALNKVHAGFYRLSEDLDFVIPTAADAPRRLRREIARPIKEGLEQQLQVLTCFRKEEEFQAHDDNRHHVIVYRYNSCLSGEGGTIKIEIAIREPLIEQRERRTAKTILVNPNTLKPVLPPVSVAVMSRRETYAEKARAALTRLAIRDHYDLDYAVRSGILDLGEDEFVRLVKLKLSVPGKMNPDVSEMALAELRRQVDAELGPVLRAQDFADFDLQRAFEMIRRVYGRIG